ncbi:MAG TPA: replicative DNA helicase [Solibacterales bacterium]|nr:replicative DNA helicase [Bryobacterales bacterium]
MSAPDIAYEKGLPANLDAERFVLGSILIDDANFIAVRAILDPEDFLLEKHRRIFMRMSEIAERGGRIDRVTLAEELMRNNQLESCDGITYLISLDEGLPQLYNLDSYVQIVKDKSVLRRIVFSSQHLINRAIAGEASPDDLLADAEENFLQIGQSRVRETMATPEAVIREAGGLNAFLDPSRRMNGIETGFLKFDEMTGGLHGGELVILAARPAMGKTALALNIGQHIATRSRLPVAVFSLEMSKQSLLTRMVCAGARVDQQKFRAGYLNQDERRRLQVAASELVDAPLFIDDTSAANLMDIHSKLRRLKNESGLGLVIIDYLQLMQGRGRFENRTTEVSSISRGLKLLAMELEVPFLVLSQLSRAPETRPGDHKPQLSDLRESGSIEQDADLVCFIYREEIYKPDRGDLKGLADLILAKQRNGPTGRVPLIFLREFTKFENRADDIGAADE